MTGSGCLLVLLVDDLGCLRVVFVGIRIGVGVGFGGMRRVVRRLLRHLEREV